MHEEMGDLRPTQFLRHLRTLAGPLVPQGFLRTFWINRLLPKFQAIIAPQALVALDDVAQLADTIAEFKPPPCVARVASPDTDISILTDRIDKLARQGAAFSARLFRPRSTSRTQHARRPARSAERSPAPHKLWYHRRLKEHAERCTALCTWQQGNAESSR